MAAPASNMQVVKVKCGAHVCRITAVKSDSERISFFALEERLRSCFKISPSSIFKITYVDVDGDTILVASDADIEDALVYQQLNPLRLELTVEDGKSESGKSHNSGTPGVEGPPPTAAPPPAATTSKATAAMQDDSIRELSNMVEKQLKQVLGVNDDVGKIIRAYEPLLQTAPQKIAEVLSAAMKSGLSVSFEPVVEPAVSPDTASGAKVDLNAGASGIPPAPSVPAASMPADVIGKVAKATTSAAAAAAAVAAAIKATSAAAAAGASTAGAGAGAGAGAAAAAASEAVETAAESETPLVEHVGIICDGCDMNPLVGPRFKSLKKYDYDLCEGCFKKMGVSDEYQRIEKCVRGGVPMRPHGSFHGPCYVAPGQAGLRNPLRCQPAPNAAPQWQHRGMPFGSPAASPRVGPIVHKLDSRFVRDMTVFDHTEVPAGTHFTKIWRMRNTGTLPWPQLTQIVHIGGDVLGEKLAATLSLPEGGVPPDVEVDVPVDMVAPERAGRYVSHWRLCAPGGPKFGHRVWALIQVVPSIPPAAPAVVKDALPAPPAAEDPVVAQIATSVSPFSNGAAAGNPTKAAIERPAANSSAAGAEGQVQLAADAGVGAAPDLSDDALGFVNTESYVAVAAGGSCSGNALAPAVDSGSEAVLVEVPKPEEPTDLLTGGVPSVPPADTVVTDFPLVAPIGVAETETKVADAADGFVNIGEGASPSKASAPNGEALEAFTPVTMEEVPRTATAATAAADAARRLMFDEGVKGTVGAEGAENGEESAMLVQLEGMGFADRDLNLEALRKAGGDLEMAVDMMLNLPPQWDADLQELEELGFVDVCVNKSLMFKNDGSKKQTIKDLVKMYSQK